MYEDTALTADAVRNGASYLEVVGRLKTGVSLDVAAAELASLAPAYTQQFAGRSDAANTTVLIPFVTQLVGDRRPIVLLLLAAVGAVLFVLCMNASTLFLGKLLGQ